MVRYFAMILCLLSTFLFSNDLLSAEEEMSIEQCKNLKDILVSQKGKYKEYKSYIQTKKQEILKIDFDLDDLKNYVKREPSSILQASHKISNLDKEKDANIYRLGWAVYKTHELSFIHKVYKIHCLKETL